MSPNPSFPTSWWVQTNKQSLLISEIAVPLWRMFSLTSLLMSSPQATGLYVAFQDNSACDWPPCPAAKLVAVGGGFRCRHTESLWSCCVFHLPWSCSGTSWVPAGQMTSEIPCIMLFPSTRKQLGGLWSQQEWSRVTGTFHLASAGNPGILLGGINTVTPGKTWSVQEIKVALLWDLRLRKIVCALSLQRQALWMPNSLTRLLKSVVSFCYRWFWTFRTEYGCIEYWW